MHKVTPDKTIMKCGIGAALEKVVLFNSKPLFKEGSITISPPDKSATQTLIEGQKYKSNCLDRFCWWNPPEDNLPVEFCRNSSIHGLAFIGRRQLHLSERIFWTIAFTLGVVAAYFLINDVWQRYYQNPVIVTYQAQEVDIDSIPFPSVTICSMNAFPKSEVQRLQKAARKSGSEEARVAREALKYVREICHSQVSFAKEFHFAYNRGELGLDLGLNDTITTDDAQAEMMDFLLKPMKCGDHFKPMITDFGKCCTFNILPLPLLLNRPDVGPVMEGNEGPKSKKPAQGQGSIRHWSDEELDLWRGWNYDKEGFIMLNKSQPRPFRQKRAGMPYGLSLLVDPNLDDWYCPVSDSEGFRFVLHNPLEMPFVNEFASLLQLNQEIMVEIHPEVTNADDDIRDFDKNARNCYFPEEQELRFYEPYTTGNCFAECTALALQRRCNCTYFYMPRDDKTDVCNSDPESEDHKCADHARSELLKSLKTQCIHCDSLCEDIAYNFETTTASLQDPLKLWNDPHPRLGGPPAWANNKMSIIHIFLGSETVVPKLRKRMYGTTDLIANTGGLLGLCLGFSILSAMEVIYFLTLRIFWRICWKKLSKRSKDRATLIAMNASRHRVIQLSPHQVPLVQFPMYHSLKKYPGVPQPYHLSAFLMEKKGV